MSRIATILFIIYHFAASAQINLVPNPGFEDYNLCPISVSAIQYSPGYTNFKYLKAWVRPSFGSSDFFHACAPVSSGVNVPNTASGVHNAHGGNGMTGIYGYTAGGASEYLQCKLTNKMIPGEKYFVSFYCYLLMDSLHGFDVWTLDRMGMTFSDTQYDGNFALLPLQYSIANPTGDYLDKIGQWMKIEGIYTAKGGEEWLVLGAFDEGVPIATKKLSGNGSKPYKAYYFIDDVSVIVYCDTVATRTDTTICRQAPFGAELSIQRDSIQLYKWNSGATTKTITINEAGKYWCISQRGCSIYTDTFIVTGLAVKNTSQQVPSCNGEDEMSSTVAGASNYVWNTGDTTAAVKQSGFGTYWCRAVKDCVLQTDTFHVYSRARVSGFEIINDTTICEGDAINVGKSYEYANKYEWNSAGTSCCISVSQPGTYTLTVHDDCQQLTDSFILSTMRCIDCIFMPNAFTPNNDNTNDVFSPIFICSVKKYSMRIFDRWGALVFETSDIKKGWDGIYRGQQANVGVYYYFVSYSALNDDKTKILKGDVTLIR